MNDFNKTVSEIVRTDYRTSDVFRKYGINYCCSGQVSLDEACAQKGLDYSAIIEELNQATRNIRLPNTIQFDQWKIDFLIDYIINVHHAYANQILPSLEANLVSFANSHQKQFPEMPQLVAAFSNLSTLIIAHNRHEEEIIFPYIKQIDNTFRRKESYGGLFVRTLRKPFHSVDGEHKHIGELFQDIRRLTNNYTFPDSACTSHRVVFQKLQEFDNDMVQHNYLENNVLFPKVMEMEKQLLQL